MKWKKILTRNASILDRSLLMEGIGEKCIVLPKWKGFQNQYWSWENGETFIHYLQTELEEFSVLLRNSARQESNFGERYKESSKKICEEAVKRTQEAAKKVKKDLTNEDLNKLFQEFCKSFRSLGHTIIMPQEENQEEVLKRLEKCKTGKAPEEALGILAAPSEISIETEEELERLDIIREIEESKEATILFLEEKEKIHEGINKQEYKKIKEKIEAHCKKYCWIPISFQKDMWDMKFYINLLQSYIKEKYDWKTRKREILSLQKEKEQAKKEIGNKVDEETKRLIALLQEGAFIRLYRANMFSLVLYSAFPILEEIGKRVGVTRKEIKWFTHKEISEALVHKKQLNKKKAEERKESFVILIENGTYQQYEGKEAEEMILRESPREEIKKSNQVKGMCAYPGKVQGIVRIIFDARESSKIKKGDILVCKETNPDLVLLMERAGAIVTDEGGVTSHAAVVSREMKKPCIIGTKIATKILKDGDLVEVNAEKGIVRKIQ